MKNILWIGVLSLFAFTSCKDDETIVEQIIPIEKDYSGLVLNEICGDDGSGKNEDWIELYNLSNSTIDLSGVKLVKTDEDGVSEELCTFADGSEIHSESYVVKTKNVDFTQGISNSKNVVITLETPDGKLIDEFDKAEVFGNDGNHETGGSYSRIPDGKGEWTIVIESTKGIANKIVEPDPMDVYKGLVLNEICGDDGSVGNEDWIELYNTTDGMIDLEGVELVKIDEDGISEVLYTFSGGAGISGKSYMLKIKGLDFTQGISNTKNLVIVLQAPTGDEIDRFDKASLFGNDGGHEQGGSYSRIPDGVGDWTIVAQATKGTANTDEVPDVPEDGDYTGLALNEICGDDGSVDGGEDWIELYNASDVAIDLKGIKLIKTDEDGVVETLCTFEDDATIAGKSYLVKVKDTDFNAGISNKKNVAITLQAPSGAEIDKFDKAVLLGDDGNHIPGGSYSRIPDGTGEWMSVSEATKGMANKGGSDIPSDIDYTVLKLNELNGNDKYIELYNTSDEAIDLGGVQLRKDEEEVVYIAAKGVTIPAKGYLTLWSEKADADVDNNLIFSSGLSADKSLKMQLLSPSNEEIDVFINPKKVENTQWGGEGSYSGEKDENGNDVNRSFGRNIDGEGEWYVMDPSLDSTNENATIYQKIE